MTRRAWPDLLLLVLPAAHAFAVTPPAVALIDACIDAQFAAAETTPQLHARIDIANACPDLHAELNLSDAAERFELGDAAELTLSQLIDLGYFLDPQRAAPGPQAQLDTADLDTILADALQTEAAVEKLGWWEALLAWLRGRRGDREDVELDWLEDWLERFSVSESTARVIQYSLSALLILLAVALIANEIRHSRGTWRPRFNLRRTLAAGSGADSRSHDARDAQQLPNSDEPARLLAACVEYLRAHERIPTRPGMTNRELLGHLRSRRDAALASFQTLVEQAERVVYGGATAGPDARSLCFNEARAIVDPASTGGAQP